MVCDITVVMFETAKRVSRDKCLSAGPVNSTILSDAVVFRLSTWRMYKMISLPPIPGFGSPTRRILMVSGTLNHVSPVTNGKVTSAAPSPTARQPTAPEEHVCESEPTTSIPGCARSR